MQQSPAISLWLIDSLVAQPIFLTPQEHARAMRLRNERQRETWIATRSSLRRVLGDGLRCHPLSVSFSSGPHGKPSLVTGPYFSVSHSGRYGLISLSDEVEVGVDLEQHRADLNVPQLFRLTLTDKEIDSLTKQPEHTQRLAFYRLWVRKEAVLKAIGRGLAGGLKSVDVLTDHVPAVGVTVADIAAPADCSAALAACGAARPVWRFRELPRLAV